MSAAEPGRRSQDEHDALLDAGGTPWCGGRDYLLSLWPGAKFARTAHAHWHKDGPEFQHAHQGGADPHDHQPGDRELPKWARS